MRGARLKDTVEIVSLKPCHLTIVQGNEHHELNLSPLYTITAHSLSFVSLSFIRGLHGRARRRTHSATPRHRGLHHLLRLRLRRRSSKTPRRKVQRPQRTRFRKWTRNKPETQTRGSEFGPGQCQKRQS